MLERIRRSIEAHGVRPAGGAVAGPLERVVVAPAGASLDDAFARAHAALERGESVRVVGYGVSYASAWPAWARLQPRLTVVELGAYEGRTRMEASRPLAAALVAWCDEVFDGVIEGLRGSEVFRAGAAARLLQGAMDAAAVVEGLIAIHPCAAIEVVDPSWAGAVALSGERRSGASERSWLLPGVVTAGVLASAGRALIDHARGAAARARLDAADAELLPRLWLALIPDWARANKHLVSTLAREALDAGEPLGVLLVGSWGVGARDDGTHGVVGREIWPGLTWLREHHPGRVRVVQAVMPADRSALLVALARAAVGSARATSRAMRAGMPPGTPDSVGLVELGKLLSRDIVQAVLAADAAGDARARVGSDPRIVFCAANLPALAAVERVLARGGVPTAEYMHGVGNDAWHGTAESHVGRRFVWTDSDARGLAPTGQHTVTAGLPVPPRVDRPIGHQNVLLLTNYFHRDLAMRGRVAQRGAYQRELLAIPGLLRAELPGWPLRVRWRAHPAEVRELVDAAHAELEEVELSTSSDLAEDLAWADVVVSAHSSTVAESIFAGRPAFVHLRPELVDSPFASYAHAARRFRKAEEAVPNIAVCLRALAAGDHETALAPERASRALLIGGDDDATEPVSLFTAVREWIRAETVE